MTTMNDLSTIREALDYGLGMALAEQSRTGKSHSILMQHFKDALAALSRLEASAGKPVVPSPAPVEHASTLGVSEGLQRKIDRVDALLAKRSPAPVELSEVLEAGDAMSSGWKRFIESPKNSDERLDATQDMGEDVDYWTTATAKFRKQP